jgi:CubicO group peptidase (beta-lactamase class C family)
MQSDLYLTDEQAVEHGLVDEVLKPDRKTAASITVPVHAAISPELEAFLERVERVAALLPEIPAAGGQGNARSIARVHSILANGGEVDGRRYLSEAGCRRALELQVEGQDLVMHAPARFGLGFGLAGPALPAPNPNTIFWGGYGGSLAIIDMDARTSFGYAMNRMAPTTTGDMRGFGLIMEIWMA